MKYSFYFSEWLKESDIDQHGWENLSPEELASLLRQFYCEMRMKNGEKYSTSGYKGIRDAISRHLTTPPHNKTLKIKSDNEFIQANRMFDAMTRSLRKEGKDSATHKVAVSREDMKKLSESIDPTTPVGLQETFFLRFLSKFARRGREGLRYLQKDHLVFGYCPREQRNYVSVCVNEATKKDQSGGGAGGNVNEGERNKRMWETPGVPNSSYEIAKQYTSLLNSNIRTHDGKVESPLWQKPNPYYNGTTQKRWYDASPMGVHKIEEMMPDMSQKYKLSRRYTNHCLRATTITTLHDAGFAPQDICKVTGHKSAESLKHYIDAASTSKSVEAADVLENFLNHQSDIPRQPFKDISNQRHVRPSSTVTSTSTLGAEPPRTSSDTFDHHPLAPRDQSDEIATQPAASSSNTNTVMDFNFSNISNLPTAMFSGANLQGCTINFNFNMK